MSNRNIAFRAWDRCKNKMTYKVLIGNTDMDDPNYTCTTVLGENGWVHDDGTCLALMQFTGLKDKNGTKIYEGDILEFQDKWEWYRGEWAAKLHFADKDKRAERQKEFDLLPTHKVVVEIDHEGVGFMASDVSNGYFVVIGNKYENPELLA